jgi:hypothetical protein
VETFTSQREGISMKKLRLDLEEIRVESFETTSLDAGGRGTVHGHGVVYPGDGIPTEKITYHAQDTCRDSCFSCQILFSGCCTNDAVYGCASEYRICVAEPTTGATTDTNIG